MPPHKLTRKELRQDGFVAWTGRAVDFLQDHYLKLAIGVLAVVVVVVGTSLYRQGETRSAHQATYLLYQGENFHARGLYLPARERLQECITRFGGTDAAKRARLDLANVLMAMGENEAALVAVEEGLRDVAAGRPLHRDLQAAKAAALQNLRRYNEATAIYEDLLAENPPDHLLFEYSLRHADCLKASGQMDEAVAVLEDLQARIDAGELSVPTRELATRLQVFRALNL